MHYLETDLVAPYAAAELGYSAALRSSQPVAAPGIFV